MAIEAKLPEVGPPLPEASVTLSKGDSAKGQPGCVSTYCRWFRVEADGLGSGPYGIECWHGGVGRHIRQAFERESVEDLPNERICYFGFPGKTVWVVVNGVKSNEIIW